MITIKYDFEYTEEYVKDRNFSEDYGHSCNLIENHRDGQVTFKNFGEVNRKAAEAATAELLDMAMERKWIKSYSNLR
jgi:hypothetical protein